MLRRSRRTVAEKSLTRRMARIGITVGIVAVVLATISLIALNALQISFFAISGSSMEPTLSNRDSVIIRQAEDIEVGNLVFFYLPRAWTYDEALARYGDQPPIVVKRIIAVEGDTFSYDGTDFLVNGESVFSVEDERYSCGDRVPGFSRELKAGEVLVFGDNAAASLDSRRVFCDGKKDFLVGEDAIVDHGTVAFRF